MKKVFGVLKNYISLSYQNLRNMSHTLVNFKTEIKYFINFFVVVQMCRETGQIYLSVFYEGHSEESKEFNSKSDEESYKRYVNNLIALGAKLVKY